MVRMNFQEFKNYCETNTWPRENFPVTGIDIHIGLTIHQNNLNEFSELLKEGKLPKEFAITMSILGLTHIALEHERFLVNAKIVKRPKVVTYGNVLERKHVEPVMDGFKNLETNKNSSESVIVDLMLIPNLNLEALEYVANSLPSITKILAVDNKLKDRSDRSELRARATIDFYCLRNRMLYLLKQYPEHRNIILALSSTRMKDVKFPPNSAVSAQELAGAVLSHSEINLDVLPKALQDYVKEIDEIEKKYREIEEEYRQSGMNPRR
jgi:hypothetical protein